jgi:hypothetical protein
MKMKSILIASGAALFAAALATPAAAVTVEPGVYIFEAPDTTTQTITVSIDGNGDTAVTSLNISFIAPCRITATETAYTLDSDWGFGGDYVIKPDGKVTFSATGNYFTFDVTLEFGNNGTATVGTITSYGATLYPQNPAVAHPTHALFCISPYQATTFQSYSAPGAVPAVSAHNTAKSVGSAQ